MRSVVKQPGSGVNVLVAQQFAVARQIIAAGLVPIIEPEVDIHSPHTAAAEEQLKVRLLDGLAGLGPDEYVMFKLTPPEEDDIYADLVAHPNVVRVVFLSGGYSRDEANERLARNHGVVASFSRALTQGLTAQQGDEEFNAMLDESIASSRRPPPPESPMELFLDCLPCLLRQVLEAARMASDDEAVQARIMDDAVATLARHGEFATAPAMAAEMHALVRRHTGVDDPYAAIKARDLAGALRLVPLGPAAEAAEPLAAALKVSATGNVMDSAIYADLDIEAVVQGELERPFAVADVEPLRAALGGGGTVAGDRGQRGRGGVRHPAAARAGPRSRGGARGARPAHHQ